MENLKPLRNHVAIRPDPIADTSNGGIFIGAVPAPMHRNGEVVAVGDECQIKVGDRCMYMPRRAITSDGLHIVNETDDIIGIFDKTKPLGLNLIA